MFSEVALTGPAHRTLTDAVHSAWPRELLAVLGGTCQQLVAHVDTVLPMTNQADGCGAFVVDGIDFARREHALRNDDRCWLGFVHSHPGGRAEPSQRDRRELWRDCLQLIAAAANDRDEPVLRAFVLQPSATTGPVVTPIPVRIGEPS